MTQAPEQESPSAVPAGRYEGPWTDHEDFCRDRLDRELELLNQRTTWMVTAQSFLFTAFAISLSAGANSHRSEIDRMIHLLPWTAIASLVLLFMSQLGALLAMMRLRRSIKESTDPLVRSLTTGERVSAVLGLLGNVLIPVVFLTTWMSLIGDD